jgi:hypothetical protein
MREDRGYEGKSHRLENCSKDEPLNPECKAVYYFVRRGQSRGREWKGEFSGKSDPIG